VAKADPARDLERSWDERVVANREQVERHRRVEEAEDFYAPVSARFVQDPRREGDAVLDALLELAQPDDDWLDIGAGAGRFALPLALHVRHVTALDPSRGMLAALRDEMGRHGITNIDVIEARWPPAGSDPVVAAHDVALIAHVGYDVEPIGPFLDAMEAAAHVRCVAVLREQAPATYAAPFWPIIHGVQRVPLPACADFVALLEARGRRPRVRRISEPPRRWDDTETLVAQLRHQLWIGADGSDNDRLVEAVQALATRDAEGVGLPAEPAWIGVVDWRPSSH
jgi:SAM-dependent methyltransferase